MGSVLSRTWLRHEDGPGGPGMAVGTRAETQNGHVARGCGAGWGPSVHVLPAV